MTSSISETSILLRYQIDRLQVTYKHQQRRLMSEKSRLPYVLLPVKKRIGFEEILNAFLSMGFH